jgi:FUS-interacting serine-arginine-rich protein 1
MIQFLSFSPLKKNLKLNSDSKKAKPRPSYRAFPNRVSMISSVTTRQSLYTQLRPEMLADPVLRAVLKGEVSIEDATVFATVIANAETEALHQQQQQQLYNSKQVRALIVRNLPRDVTIEEIRGIFEKYGAIRDIYIPKNQDASSPYYHCVKGFAVVKYINHTSATTAFLAESNRILLRGKLVNIEIAKEDR